MILNTGPCTGQQCSVETGLLTLLFCTFSLDREYRDCKKVQLLWLTEGLKNVQWNLIFVAGCLSDIWISVFAAASRWQPQPPGAACCLLRSSVGAKSLPIKLFANFQFLWSLINKTCIHPTHNNAGEEFLKLRDESSWGQSQGNVVRTISLWFW